MKREFNLDIVGKKKIFFIISSALILIAILVSIIFGVKVDIKFQGGSMITYSYTGDINLEDTESFIKSAMDKENSIQGSTDIATGRQSMIISLTEKDGLTVEEQQKLTEELTNKYKDNNLEMISTTNVGASIGQEFFKKCWVAVIFSALLMIIYIGFRFKKISGWSAGVMAVVALLHDVAMVYATFVIFRIPLNDNFMAVVLTILGYSVNDTIVIYDRIRENKKIYGKTIFQHIISCRINYGKHLLRFSDNSVEEIAHQCGFNDQSYFVRQFKKSENVTCFAYRRMWRN